MALWSPWLGGLSLAAVLAGFGTRMAAGCTSGHGRCGVSRAQRRQSGTDG
jgi:uncharacterized membrane protein YedE/YeeE